MGIVLEEGLVAAVTSKDSHATSWPGMGGRYEQPCCERAREAEPSGEGGFCSSRKVRGCSEFQAIRAFHWRGHGIQALKMRLGQCAKAYRV